MLSISKCPVTTQFLTQRNAKISKKAQRYLDLFSLRGIIRTSCVLLPYTLTWFIRECGRLELKWVFVCLLSCLVSYSCRANNRTIYPNHVAVYDATYGVNLVLTDQNHLVAKATVNGKPCWLAVDTGAPLSVFDTGDAPSYHVPLSQNSVSLPRQLEINDQEAGIAYIHRLKIGELELGSGPVALVNLRGFPEIERRTGSHIRLNGILGMDILEKYQGAIDYRRMRLYLYVNNIKPKVDRSGKRVPISFTSKGTIGVNGKIRKNRYTFIIDTGAFGTFVSFTAAAENRLPIYSTRSVTKLVNYSSTPVGQTYLPDASIVHYSLRGLPVYVSLGSFTFDNLDYPFGGLIGGDFLLNRGAVIDAGKRILYLR
jgi:predicted aspartyl protease